MNAGEWDALQPNRPDGLLDIKRTAEKAIGERVGWEPDWKLKLIMLREQRQEEDSERKRLAFNRPEIREQRSQLLKKAWEDGKFAKRKQAYAKRTDERLRRARRLREQGWTYAQIAEAIGITSYTAMRWLGWQRGAGKTRAPQPVVFEGVHYRSLSEAERATGISRHTIKNRTAGG